MYRRDFASDFIPAAQARLPPIGVTNLQTLADWQKLVEFCKYKWNTPGTVFFDVLFWRDL